MKRVLFLVAASALYLIPAGVVAAARPLWHDEIFTLYLSRLPSMSDVWRALSIGTDLLPPFFYVITRAVIGVAGDSALALRLPEIIGSWVAALCLYRFVKRRGTTSDAELAMLFPLVTLCGLYVYEARPTAIVNALASVAMIAWQDACDGRRRAGAVATIALALMAAVATHYYALLLIAPFAAAETMRAVERRKLDVPVALALASAVLPLVLLRPQVHDGLAYAPAFWSRPVWGMAIEFYQIALGPAAGVIAALLVFAAVARAFRPSDTTDISPVRPAHEVVLVCGLASMPIAAVALAMLTLPVFSPRYVLWSMLGVSVLFAWSARTLFGSLRMPALCLVVVMAGAVLRGNHRALQEARSLDADLTTLETFLTQHARPGEPIVVAQPAEFLELGLHARPEFAARLVYLGDPEASIRHIQQDTADRALLSLAEFAPIRVEPYASFTATHRSFQVYVRDGRGWWLMAEVPAGRTVPIAREGSYYLWDVRAEGER